ncbi:MAG: hypothetical protein ACOCSK_01700 [Rhodothermales bacterium]
MNLFILSCKQPYDLSEYKGTNLIAGQGLAGGEWEPDREAPYTTFEQVTDTDPGWPGPPPGSGEEAVYRLELRNLFPDGDFEDATVDERPDHWDRSSVGTTAEVIDNTDSIDGRSLSLVFDSGEAVFADLEASLGDNGDAFVEDASYRFLFEFTSAGSEIGAELNNGVDASKTGYSWTMSRPPGADDTTVLRFPTDPGFGPNNTIQPDTSYNSFSFGGNSTDASVSFSDVVVDNFRIVRDDIPLFVRLGVPKSASGRPDIVGGGTYTFRIYVRDDPTAHDPSAGGDNRFRAEALSVALNPEPGEPTAGAFKSQSRTSDWSDWTELEFTLDGSQLPDEDPALEIQLLPSLDGEGIDEYARDAGSLLIASPRLYWSEK